MEDILKYDTDFTEAEFINRADHIFIMILNGIMDNDMSSVKHYIKNNIYEKFVLLTNDYKNKGLTRIFDEMNVKSTEILSHEITETEIKIKIRLTSRYMDYFLNSDGEFDSGINDHRIEKDHIIEFSKLINTKDLGEIRRCPSCGNSLDINATGVCPYCNQTIDMSKYDYIITDMNIL